MEYGLDLFCPSVSSLYGNGMETYVASCIWCKERTYSDGVCYRPRVSRIGRNATVSQRAFLCTAGHDISDPYHHQTDASIVIEDRAWVCAEAFIGQGVTIGEGAVCAARAVVVKDVESWTVVGGNPAKFIRKRVLNYE